jgi:hypothetical protein
MGLCPFFAHGTAILGGFLPLPARFLAQKMLHLGVKLRSDKKLLI